MQRRGRFDLWVLCPWPETPAIRRLRSRHVCIRGRKQIARGLLARFVAGNGETGSGLVHDEADVAMAVQSAYGIVLTNERPTKDGPLQYVARKGGKVLYLKLFEPSGLSLRAFISAFHEKD